MIRILLIAAALLLAAPAALLAQTVLAQTIEVQPPSDPVERFATAKRIARNVIYAGHRTTLYCACAYTHRGTSGGRIEPKACGYEVRKSRTRGARLEWEHIMPASFFGRDLPCWREGHRICVNSKGKPYRGRKCCAKVDRTFERMESDLHNLAPSVGELNGDRSNLPYGEVEKKQEQEKERGDYGDCDFKIGKPASGFAVTDPRARKVTEPADAVKGDVARVWLYMIEAYDLEVRAAARAALMDWSETDPPDKWEVERDKRIEAEQGNSNPFVRPRPGS